MNIVLGDTNITMTNSQILTGFVDPHNSENAHNSGNVLVVLIQTSDNTIDNNSNPLYLHNNDQYGIILIYEKFFGFENFSS